VTIPIFDEAPEFGWDREPALPVTEFRFAGAGSRQTVAHQAVARDRIRWPMKRSKADATTIDEFFVARSQVVTSFFVKLPWPFSRTGVSLGTSIAAQTVFDLPSSGDEFRDYPIDDANLVVYDDGTPVTVSSVDTDARQVTLSAVPTVGSVMTADYHYYRRVKLAAPFAWTHIGPDWLEAEPEFEEVPE